MCIFNGDLESWKALDRCSANPRSHRYHPRQFISHIIFGVRANKINYFELLLLLNLFIWCIVYMYEWVCVYVVCEYVHHKWLYAYGGREEYILRESVFSFHNRHCRNWPLVQKIDSTCLGGYFWVNWVKTSFITSQ